ncbi:MAG: type II toxin-antitoxin system prevent-host-death family antitoxin [Streptosporangiales bacterium]|nr:type II toxin-antitoxin system prevent-host-death family antitoxin [Streptosporangiales bacterium]
MVEVGVRELRDHLSRWLERVRAGEEVVVTDRGHAVARITPTGRSRLDELIAKGIVTPARRRKDESLPVPVQAEGTVSDLVAEQRR